MSRGWFRLFIKREGLDGDTLRCMRFAVVILMLTAVTGSRAQSPLGPVPTYEVKKTAEFIKIDGRLQEKAWQAAPKIELIFPWAFQTGKHQKTIARILWDDQNLYVSYEAEDEDIVATLTQRDDPTYRDDCVEIFINPKPENLDFYVGFEMSAAAVMYDYFALPNRLYLKAMQFEGLQLATDIRGTLNRSGDKDSGWTLEVAIPWKNFVDLAVIYPPKAGDIWSANLNRWDGVEPNRVLSQWSNSGDKGPNPHHPERFGKLKFVE